MTRWDAVLINAVATIAADPIGHGRDQADMVQVIEKALRHVSHADPRIAQLVPAAIRLRDSWADRGLPAWSNALVNARNVVTTLLRWRTGALLAELEAEGGA